MLLELRFFKELHFCPETFKRLVNQHFFIKYQEIHYVSCYSAWSLKEKHNVACLDRLCNLPFIDQMRFDAYAVLCGILGKNLSIFICKYRYPSKIYVVKVNNRNTRKKCEICSKLTIKTSELRQWCRSGVFIVNVEHISHLFLVFLLLTLNK